MKKKSTSFKSSNYSQLYDPFNSSYIDEKDTLNLSKANQSLNNILLHQNYKTQEQSNSPQIERKKKSVRLNLKNPKYFNYDTNKENSINYNNKINTIDQYSDQDPCSLVRMNNYVLSRKYVEKDDIDKNQKRKSQSKQKENKKKKQNLNKKGSINNEKDIQNQEKSQNKVNNVNTNKNEVKRQNSNNKGIKIPIFSKVKI